VSLKTLNIGVRHEGLLRSGHPWIYRNHLPDHNLETGCWVRVNAGRHSAIGLYEPIGDVGVRLYDRDQIPDQPWVINRLRTAQDLRKGLDPTSNAYRILYGESDGFPGIVADRYDRFAVIKTYITGVDSLLVTLAKALGKTMRLKGVVARIKGDCRVLWGQEPPAEITVRENGLKFLANIYKGQKTGLYLDQRDNRAIVRNWAAGMRVLDLFSYTGGFSVYALEGGALYATIVDRADQALHDACRNVTANRFKPNQHETIRADAYEYLKTVVGRGKTYDLVILDPPSLARRKTQKTNALKAYRRLNRLAFQSVAHGGLLATSSCTTQVSPVDFRKVVAEAALSVGATAQIINETGHPPDHPIPLNFPEARYLKFLLVRVLRK
jgi:23S rRNA (cytosine1962-C5)-methyltransferase